MSKTFVLLLLLGTALAATHVDISIAQHPAGVTYVDGKAPAELRAGPAERQNYRAENSQSGSAQLRAADKSANSEFDYSRNGADSEARLYNGYNFEGRSARIQAVDNSARIQQLQQQGFNDRVTYSHSGNSNARPQQLKQRNEQDKQNQEFERYIQNHHGGPTVETVFESASPASERYQQPSAFSSSSFSAESHSGAPARIVAIGPQYKQLQTFERQVALPAAASAVSPAADANRQAHTIINYQPKQSDSVDGQQVSSASSGASSVLASSSAASAGFTANNIPYAAPSQAVNGYDQSDFGQPPVYNKPNFVHPAFNYDATQQTDLYNQYPASVDESQSGYGGYYGSNDQSGFYGGSEGGGSFGGYLPAQTPYQRPVVTKTIQIAQPALKAKKYEVRHPAIQKEFYDIEERVRIKPAGTIVVELEHPVAKIPRGETLLPLGHPHPAVASAYNQQSANAGSFGSSSSSSGYASPNNQYNSGFAQNAKAAVPEQNVLRGTTLASTITASPTYDQNSKDAFVEDNLNRQYGGGNAEPQFIATTERSYNEGKPNDHDFLVITDAQGNQRRISSKNITPNMLTKDETDFRYPNQVAQVEVKHNGAPAPATFAASQQSSTNYNNYKNNNNNNAEQAAFAPNNNQQFQANFNDNNNNNKNQFRGEYLPTEFFNNANNQQEFKPARLQQAPVHSESESNAPASNTPIITHEHNIHLPGVQHNIYLQRSEQNAVPLRRGNSRYEAEAARVLEIKPYLQQREGPVIVYASTTVRPQSGNYKQRFEQYAPQQYTQFERDQPDIAQYRGQLRNDAEGLNRVQYSAPYSHMKYLPQGSAHFTNVGAYADEKPVQARHQKLILEQNNDDNRDNGQSSSRAASENDNGKSAPRPLTHIKIEIPQHPHEADKPIVISSTISPPQDRQQQLVDNYRAADKDEAGRLDSASNYRRGGDQEYDVEHAANLASKPDCDQPRQLSARYELVPLYNPQRSRGQQTFQRIIEATNANSNVSEDAAPLAANVASVAPETVDIGVKSGSGQVPKAGSRVIAATAASTDASAASESLHKRRIVVNHPFQTVREVVEHEPITNFHQVQVNEPSLSAALYNQAPYFETHDSLRQSPSHLRYSAPVAYPVAVRYHHRG